MSEVGTSINFTDIGAVTLIKPIRASFEPKEDITAYELAKLLPLLFRGPIFLRDLPKDERLLRHLNVQWEK